MYIRAQRIIWLGHPNRLEDIKLVKITDWNPRGVKQNDQRIDGKMKWWYEEAKTKKLELVKNRKAWKDLVPQIKTHVGL
jgi:hypothetical protein